MWLCILLGKVGSKQFRYELKNQVDENDELVECLEALSSLISLEKDLENVDVATRNGGVELVLFIMWPDKSKLARCNQTIKCIAKGSSSLLIGYFKDPSRKIVTTSLSMESCESLKDCLGPKTILTILDVSEMLGTLAAGFSIVDMAADTNESSKSHLWN